MDITADLKTTRDTVSILMNKRKEVEKAIAAFKKEAKAKKEQMKDKEGNKPTKTEIRNEFVDLDIKMPDMTFIKCHVPLKMTVSQLKVRVLVEFNGIKKENLILRFGEDVGENRRRLAFYGVDATTKVYASIRGSGGAKGIKTNVFVKQSIVMNKKNALIELSNSLMNSKVSREEVMEASGAEMMRIFKLAEAEPQAAFSLLLGKVCDDAIGTKESSQLLDFFKSNKTETRIAGIGAIVMRSNYGRLFTMFDEIGGMKETADMTFDFVATSAFTKSTGGWDWALMKRAVEDEQMVRLALKNKDVME